MLLEIKSPYLQDDSENWSIHMNILQTPTVKHKSVLKHKFRLRIYLLWYPLFFPVENKYKSNQGAFAIHQNGFLIVLFHFLSRLGFTCRFKLLQASWKIQWEFFIQNFILYVQQESWFSSYCNLIIHEVPRLLDF